MSTALLNLNQALSWLPGARLIGEGATAVQRIHTDSRSLEAGDFFVALKGDRFDGNQFLKQAQELGASAALCDSSAEATLKQIGLPGILVPDCRVALGQLAREWRKQFDLPLIAVTGSNGKTTVTQMIAAILHAFRPDAYLATQGNLNNEIGVPLTLLRLRAHHKIAVVELGMNHPGEIEKLAAMAQPTVALVNNAQREHLEFMASIEAVANENGAVLKSLASQGIAVFPADDRFSPLWTELARSQQTITFGMDLPTSAGQVTCMRPRWSRNAWDVKAKTIAGGLHFKLRIAGLHNVMNSLAAISCALAAGVPLDMIEQGLEKFEPVKGRSRIQLLTVAGHAITLVDDSYNANPDSVRAAIDVLAGLPGPRLLVLGDMGEVGHEGADLHAEVGGYARQCGIELLYGLGAMTTKAVEQYGAGKHFPDMNALNQATLEVLPKMSSVLVKGSRFMRMEQVVQAILAKTQIEQEKSKASHAN